MDGLLGHGDFDIPGKDASEEDLSSWRSSVGLVKNHSRRYRNVADLAVRTQAKDRIRQTQEPLRVLLYVQRAAFRFIDAAAAAAASSSSTLQEQLSEKAQRQGFKIHPNQLASIVRNHDINLLRSHGGLHGIAAKINVSLDEGVDSHDVQKRQNIYGSNTFAERPSTTFWMFLWEALHDVTLVILIVCALVSIPVGLATEGWPTGIYDGLGILLSIILVVAVTAVSDYGQSLQFQDLEREKKNIIVQVTRDGYRQKVSIFELVVGDVVHLSIGDQVPADGVFISGYSLLTDESSLTGESEPVEINRERPFLLAGTKVQDGSAKMLVTTVGMRTEWGKLTEALNDGGEDETPLQVKLNGVATVIGKIGLAFSVLTFTVLVVRLLINKAVHENLTDWSSTDALQLLNYFATAVTIIVVAVPEGLPLAVTLSLAFAMKKLMNEKALVRDLAACETMGSVTSICTDKTGTLTTNHMVVNKIWLSGNNYEQDTLMALNVSENCLTILMQAIFQNTAAEVVLGKDGNHSVLGTPTESAILEYGLLLGGNFNSQRREIRILKVEPFNSVKKKMSVLVSLPDGRKRAFCKGASEIILGICNSMVDVNGETVAISVDVNDVINGFASDALRTLSLAYKDIDYDYDYDHEDGNGIIPDDGYTLVAVVGIKDPVRPGVKEAVQICLAAGITVRMVTGDNINTAKAIARECGILTGAGLAIEGSDFRSKSPEDLKSILPTIQVMARSLPLDKHSLVSNLKKLGEVVAVTGDGINDAPALHESNIGLAMGIAGTEVAKENADVIILDDNFKTIVNVAKWGRAVYINIQKFVQFQLTVNIVALMLNFVSACVTASAPLTAVQLLWVNLIMDTLGALALATEPPNEELMKRPPVRKETGFITKIMWRNILGQSIYQLIILFVLTFDGLNLLRLEEDSNGTKILNTFIFNTFVFCQVFNEINSRDMEKINVFSGLFKSWVFIIIIVSTAAFQAIIVEFLGAFASTVPLSWQLWSLSILIGAISLPVGIVLKCILINKAPQLYHHDHNGYEPLPSGPEMA